MDPTYLLPVFETIQLSWQKVKGCKRSLWGAYGLACITAFILGLIIGLLQFSGNPTLTSFSSIMKPLVSVIVVIFGFGILRLGVRRALDQPISAGMVFYPFKHFTLILKLLGGWLLYFLILMPCMAIGLFAVPFAIYLFAFSLKFLNTTTALPIFYLIAGFLVGFSVALTIYLMVRLRLAWGFIVDKELGPWQAINLSYKVTRHNFWRLLCLYIINSGIFFLSLLPLGLGLIWSMPYLLINYGMVYRKLVEGQGGTAGG